MLKILQARLQQYVIWELLDVQAGFRKGRETEIKLPTSVGSSKKQEFQNSTSASLTTSKPLCGSQKTAKFWKRGEYQTTWYFWETDMQVKKQQLETDMEQLIGSKLGKEYIKDVYRHPAYLTYMQSTSCKMLGWM